MQNNDLKLLVISLDGAAIDVIQPMTFGKDP